MDQSHPSSGGYGEGGMSQQLWKNMFPTWDEKGLWPAGGPDRATMLYAWMSYVPRVTGSDGEVRSIEVYVKATSLFDRERAR